MTGASEDLLKISIQVYTDRITFTIDVGVYLGRSVVRKGTVENNEITK